MSLAGTVLNGTDANGALSPKPFMSTDHVQASPILSVALRINSAETLHLQLA